MSADHMTPALEAEIIADMMNDDGFDMRIVEPGVAEFTDRTADRVKVFRMTVTEVR